MRCTKWCLLTEGVKMGHVNVAHGLCHFKNTIRRKKSGLKGHVHNEIPQ